MAEILIEGTNLGYTEGDYDFVNDAGERINGTSHRLHLLCGLDKFELKVPNDMIATARALPVREVVALKVAIPKGTRLSLVDAETL